MEQTYLNQLRTVLETGSRRKDRTGVGTLACFGLQARYAMADGFPAVTTKKLAFKTMAAELLWFISGSDNINELKKILPSSKIWDDNHRDFRRRLADTEDHTSEDSGSMGRIYGVQWRRWKTTDGQEVDQLTNAIDLIRHNPASRRIIVNAWNAGEVGPNDVALPPCHSFFQFFVADGRLSMQMYQRSADLFLGVPFNIASYSLLLHMVAKITGLKAHEFIHTIGDAHIYLNHLDEVHEQLSRTPMSAPQLDIRDRGQTAIDDFVMADFNLVDYRCHPPIQARLAV